MNSKFDMKCVDEYTYTVPGKHSYYFDTLRDKGYMVMETIVQTACKRKHFERSVCPRERIYDLD